MSRPTDAVEVRSLKTRPLFFQCTHHPAPFNLPVIQDYLKWTDETGNSMASLALDAKFGMNCLTLSDTVHTFVLLKAISTLTFSFISRNSAVEILSFSSMLLYVHRNHKACSGRGVQDDHLDFHTAPEPSNSVSYLFILYVAHMDVVFHCLG